MTNLDRVKQLRNEIDVLQDKRFMRDRPKKPYIEHTDTISALIRDLIDTMTELSQVEYSEYKTCYRDQEFGDDYWG